jgi:serine/threonine-protein kinase
VDGRYRVEAVLGEGGMGVVYRCTHTIIGKKVAMKVLRADFARDPEVTERFLNEARAASAIGNAHIVDISDFGQFPDGATYFIMEHLTGTPLSKLLEGGTPVELPRLLAIARELCAGLTAAHAAGIVHRDLKPDNVFLIQRGAERDFVKILDFGIAKVSTGGAPKLTQAGAVFGTPHYMSPEQAAGNPVDQRGDVYSLGIMLYEMASGRVPFDADSFMAILTQHLHKAPPPLTELEPPVPGISPALDAVVLKCLSKRPEDRYPDMAALDADLERLERGEEPLALHEQLQRSQPFALPGEYFQKARPAASRRRGLVFGAGALCLAAVTAVLLTRPDAAPESDVAASTRAQSPEARSARPGAEASPLPPPVIAPQAALPVAAAAKRVLVAVEPLDAHIYRGSDDLGTSPVLLELGAGEKHELRIRREGYAEAVLLLDGSKAREVVKLTPLPRAGGQPAKPAPAKAPPRTAPSAKKRSALGGGDIVNPWD